MFASMTKIPVVGGKYDGDKVVVPVPIQTVSLDGVPYTLRDLAGANGRVRVFGFADLSDQDVEDRVLSVAATT